MFIFDLAVSGILAAPGSAIRDRLSRVGHRARSNGPYGRRGNRIWGDPGFARGDDERLPLLRKPWAVVLGYLLLLATCGSLIVSFWQLSFQWKGFPPGSPERIGVVIGAGFTLCVRFGLMAAYFAALRQFATWAMCPAEGVVLPADYQE